MTDDFANTIESGDPTSLGANVVGDGVNFALYSAHAARIELCIYDHTGTHELARCDLPEKRNHVWHGYVPKLSDELTYGYRVHGAYDPHAGHRFNPHKLLLDPYAKLLAGGFIWQDAHFGCDTFSPEGDFKLDTQDNSRWMPKGRFYKAGAKARNVSINTKINNKSLIYEAHLRGLTKSNTAIPESIRGTFQGLGHDSVIQHLKSIGVTTVELLPVHSFIDEHRLHKMGLSNYWGYNTLNFFAPHSAYLADDNPDQIRATIERLHDAGIRVILDVVYNHTAEGNENGPTLSFRGIDNASYYQLYPEDKRYYINDSGCGNTINIRHPRVLQLVMDSLRHWVCAYGVDGFRFDLASILGREKLGFDAQSSFFQTIAQDPILSRVTLIAEPWDIGPGGYQLGRYPPGWSEWNDKYRDTVRRFWRGDRGVLPELAKRLHGSSDLFEHAGRAPTASINLITAHDGFTLRDLVSYSRRHNEANGEDNRDGHSENLSNNNGAEGPTDDPAIQAQRLKMQKNLLATLILSQGVPMLTAGDEFGRTQLGNNNAYCQDNELCWHDWGLITEGNSLLQFFRRLMNIAAENSVSHFPQYTHAAKGLHEAGIHWVDVDGSEMTAQAWHESDRTVLGYLMFPGTKHERGGASSTSALLVYFNNGNESADVVLPTIPRYSQWDLLLDTDLEEDSTQDLGQAGESRSLAAMSLQLYKAEIQNP